jgi:hypothetical protein
MEPGLWNAAAGPIGEWENKVLRSIPITDVTFSPGTKFSYSNIGYGIQDERPDAPAGDHKDMGI